MKRFGNADRITDKDEQEREGILWIAIIACLFLTSWFSMIMIEMNFPSEYISGLLPIDKVREPLQIF